MKIVETSSLEGVEVNLEMVQSVSNKSKGEKQSTKSAENSSSSEVSEQKRLLSEETTKNKGFVSCLLNYSKFCYPLSTLPEHIHRAILFVRQSYL